MKTEVFILLDLKYNICTLLELKLHSLIFDISSSKFIVNLQYQYITHFYSNNGKIKESTLQWPL